MFIFLFFTMKNYFGNKETSINDQCKRINKWIVQKINNEEFEILKNNNILKNVLSHLTDNENESIFNKDLNYKKTLCLLMSTRYVIKTIHNDNKGGIFYNLVTNPLNVISNYQMFFEFYLKNFDVFNKMKRDISYLAYKMINYIILSHLYYGNLLGNLDLMDEKLISIIKLDNNIEYEENYLLKLLYNEFDSIIDDILNLIGIKKNIIYMNSIFEEVSNIIIKMNLSNDKDYIKSNESEIDSEIKYKINKFEEQVTDYYKSIELIKEKLGDDKKDIGRDIFFEENDFYNNEKENPDSKYPFISYFTSTNFCTFEDFRKQRIYLINDEIENKKYPIIDYIMAKDHIIQLIIDLLPKINELINIVYNKLILKTSKDSINMELGKIIDLSKIRLNSLNESIEKFLNLKNIKNINLKISELSKVSEIINIKDNDNALYKIYNIMIEEYNQFLTKIDIYEINKKMIEPVIIQNASENDYITFKNYINEKYSNNNKERNTISVKERLYQILYLYSNRNRIVEKVNKEQKKAFSINISDGGKIIYDYDLIEKILEKEFIFGKKIFSNLQKTFIFSNNAFSNERNNILIDLNKKYPQEKIKEEYLNIMDDIFNNAQKKESVLINYYYNILYIIIFLIEYEKEKKYDTDDTTINDILRIISSNNFKNNDEDMESFLKKDLSQSLFISHLFSLYEFIELKAFDYLTKEIKQQLNKKDLILERKIQEKVLNHFKKDNQLINKETLLNSVRKYIIRYCLGDYEDKNKILDKMYYNFEDIFKRVDIWEEKIFNDKRFNDESKELININKEGNIVLKYCFGIVFGFVVEKLERKGSIDDDDNFDIREEDEDEEEENYKRKPSKKVINYDINEGKQEEDEDDDYDYRKKKSLHNKFMNDY